MGLGIAAHLKGILPLAMYLAGIATMLMALSGKPKWALYLLTFLLPLRNVVDRVQAFPGGTQFVDLLIFSLLLAVFLHSAKRNKTAMASSSLNIISILLVIYMFISVVLGSITLTGQLGLDVHDPRVQDWKNFSLLPILFFIALNTLSTRKEVWTLFTLMCGVMFIMDYYMINQVAWYSSLESRKKITGTFQFLGPNEVAAFFNQFTIIIMSVYFAMKPGRNKWLLLIVILANTYSILFCYSRAGYLGYAVGMFILFAMKNQKLLIPLVLAAALWQVVLPEKAIERIKETKSNHGRLDESSQRRVNIWHEALSLFAQNPVTGIGYGVFRFLGLDLGDTHNIYVKILTEQGLVGLTIFLCTIICFMREGFKLYQKGEEDDITRAFGLGLVISMFVVLVNNFFGDRWSYLESCGYLWIFAGMVARLNHLAMQPKTETAAEDDLKGQVKPQSNLKTLLAKENAPKKKKKVRYYDI